MIDFNFDNTYSKLPDELFSRVTPSPVSRPRLVLFNSGLAQELGISTHAATEDELSAVFGGSSLPDNAAAIAQAYSGHQFGHFTMLGDGRAILLGEQISPSGQRYDLQFKGSGITPYSRRGDGRATLSAMLREYIFSEALNALHIPVTRSLAVVATGEPVYREDMNEGAVLTRVAQSHIRVGTFEYAQRFCTPQTLKHLLDYTIKRHFQELHNAENPALALLQKVMELQAELMVNWMRVGFIHGVMNTDNMLLSGETIDFGPCAFMNRYKASTVFSSIDYYGRYAFDKQPSIALWNLSRLAESLLSEIHSDSSKAVELATQVLSLFKPFFKETYQIMMGHKLGIAHIKPEDVELVSRLTSWMEKYKADYTNTFVQLMYPEMNLNDCFEAKEVKLWLADWRKRLAVKLAPDEEQLKLMQRNNPVYIPRNNVVESVLVRASKGDMSSFNMLMKTLSNPYAVDIFDTDYMQVPEMEYDKNYTTFCGT